MNKEVIEKALTVAGISATVIQVGDGDFVIDDAKEIPKMGHAVAPGQSIVEKIRDDLDAVYKEYKDQEKSGGADVFFNMHIAEGIAHALGILRGSSADHEWEEAEQRYEQTRLRG